MMSKQDTSKTEGKTNSLGTVLIVGAGPAGMTAALELSRFGIPVRLIEKAPEPATTSRAVGVQARTLELLEQRGLAAPSSRKETPATEPAFMARESAFFVWPSRTSTASTTTLCLYRRRKLRGASRSS